MLSFVILFGEGMLQQPSACFNYGKMAYKEMIMVMMGEVKSRVAAILRCCTKSWTVLQPRRCCIGDGEVHLVAGECFAKHDKVEEIRRESAVVF